MPVPSQRDKVDHMKKVLFITNKHKPDTLKVSLQAAQLLKDDGIECYLVQDALLPEEKGLFQLMPQADNLSEYDCIITVGGDGTILHTVARFGVKVPPILGINVGRLGFLATVEPAELSLLHHLASDDYILENRSLLCAQLQSISAENFHALNDIVIARGMVANTIRCSIYCDDTLVGNYRGDGVIISTPTGSTAYSLSAGGPIVDAKSNCILVTPICAHSMNAPAMVFAPDRILKIVVSENDKCDARFSADGTNELILEAEDTVFVHQSSHHIKLISFCNTNQLKTIDTKLKGR